MTLINKDSFKVQQHKAPLVVNEPVTKPASKNKVETVPERESPPLESFVSSQSTTPPPVKETEKPVTGTPVEPKKKLATPRPGSDMAIMLEDIEAAKIAGGEIKSNANGTLVVLQDLPTGLEPLPSSEASPTGEPTHRGDHHHGHSNKTDAMLGGHLGTEVVEKAGHNAHHAVEHAVSHGASAKTHGLHQATEAVTQGKAHGLHPATEAVTQGKAHGVGHALTEAKSELAGTAAGHKAHGASELTETAHDLGQVSQSGHNVLSEAGEHGAEAAHHLSTGLQTALGVSAAASVGLGGLMLYTGGKELAEGVKKKDGEKIAEGVGGVAVGARSLAASAVMTSMVSGSSTVAQVAAVASQALTPLGIVHGAVDVGLGVKDLVKGDKVDGLVKVGFGASVIAGAVIGGIPLTVAALGFLGVKVGRSVHKARKAKKQAAAQELAAPQPPQPSDSKNLKDAAT